MQFRKPDRGPPWLLRQVLQPDLLRAVESPATTEMLHGIYVHLAGSSNNPQDLSMNLSDIRLGLKHAAGFRCLHDLQQAQGQGVQGRGQRWGLQHNLSRQRAHGYEGSTQCSRGRSTAPGAHAGAAPALPGAGSTGCELSTGSSGTGSSSMCKPAFHVPLYKVAEFLRAAKLLPRLFDKYITQLQLQGEEQKVRLANRGLPIMPSLRTYVYAAHARSPTMGAARHRWANCWHRSS